MDKKDKINYAVMALLVLHTLFQFSQIRGLKSEVASEVSKTASTTAIMNYLVTPVDGVTGFTREVLNSIQIIQQANQPK